MRASRRPLLAVAASALALLAVSACSISTKPKSAATLTPNPTYTPVPTATGSPTGTASQTVTGSQSASRTATRTISPCATTTATVTRTGTILSSTVTATNSGTPTITPTPNIVNVTVYVDCWTGGGCTVCGFVSYLCTPAGAYTSSCTFADPCPGGRQARRAVATWNLVGCTLANIYTQLNGLSFGTVTGIAVNCVCNTCQPTAGDTGYYAGGLPGWVAGGTNTVTYQQTAGSVCLSHAEILVNCY